MRIFRNIILCVLPILVFINLYRFVVADMGSVTFQYRGFRTFFEYLSTFNGFNHAMETINEVSDIANSFKDSTTEITDLVSFFVAFGEFFKMVFTFLKLPISLLIDLVSNILWFLGLFMA